ncbi:hypothetical protein [Aeromonas diversa]|uniref:hypothetical protein n=1 Tax=Aeromonas diversa TaxID=502790 RepID=UPI00039B08F2|nr:hypothetical protein [Aeromonas diversa]
MLRIATLLMIVVSLSGQVSAEGAPAMPLQLCQLAGQVQPQLVPEYVCLWQGEQR